MAEVFEAKLRRVGNSLGIIIPKEIIWEAGLKEDDTIQVSIISSHRENRARILRSIAGTCKGTEPFERKKEDRY
ncbi:MAG: hypothetical protein KAJ64_06730 [Thermoplasmata archaeon]|nr:hypothetical protein [Thermoplasmata archaeon]